MANDALTPTIFVGSHSPQPPHLPATSAPVGVTPDGLPVGVQIIGDYLDDQTTIKFAELLSEVRGGFQPPP